MSSIRTLRKTFYGQKLPGDGTFKNARGLAHRLKMDADWGPKVYLSKPNLTERVGIRGPLSTEAVWKLCYQSQRHL